MAGGGGIAETNAPLGPMSAESPRVNGGGPGSLLVGAGLSALAWLVSCFVCSVGWMVAMSTSILRVDSWVREDSVNYVTIAAQGLRSTNCTLAQ